MLLGRTDDVYQPEMIPRANVDILSVLKGWQDESRLPFHQEVDSINFISFKENVLIFGEKLRLE